ncbi:hypothetical protein GF312_12530 [Candidatus Poribacteria bacterium]|nr:hypothetical protein [Candidatus Poribacteria bacterium]
MMNKKTGRAAVLCIVVAVTIMLVATAWVVTSRHKNKVSEPIVDSEQKIQQPDVLVDSESQQNEDIPMPESKKQKKPYIDPYFEKLEKEFFANTKTDESTKEKTEQETTKSFMKPEKSQSVAKSVDSEAEIQKVRQEAGRIVERSGLFSNKVEKDDDMLVSASERDHGLSSVKTSVESKQQKDIKAREKAVLERQAYQEAKEKVDAMLKSLGYVDKI